eukprot:TRINITY_DN470_c2_g1_i1.p1 TRINITY_DN470_c2_g1~~TRINITY_DN470_c2_g1_i1.p1  ORF type:complete len:734 (+),score=82.50 TRINITY_DN470_c2_g1_i1:2093-4294(+)
MKSGSRILHDNSNSEKSQNLKCSAIFQYCSLSVSFEYKKQNSASNFILQKKQSRSYSSNNNMKREDVESLQLKTVENLDPDILEKSQRENEEKIHKILKKRIKKRAELLPLDERALLAQSMLATIYETMKKYSREIRKVTTQWQIIKGPINEEKDGSSTALTYSIKYEPWETPEMKSLIDTFTSELDENFKEINKRIMVKNGEIQVPEMPSEIVSSLPSMHMLTLPPSNLPMDSSISGMKNVVENFDPGSLENAIDENVESLQKEWNNEANHMAEMLIAEEQGNFKEIMNKSIEKNMERYKSVIRNPTLLWEISLEIKNIEVKGNMQIRNYVIKYQLAKNEVISIITNSFEYDLSKTFSEINMKHLLPAIVGEAVGNPTAINTSLFTDKYIHHPVENVIKDTAKSIHDEGLNKTESIPISHEDTMKGPVPNLFENMPILKPGIVPSEIALNEAAFPSLPKGEGKSDSNQIFGASLFGDKVKDIHELSKKASEECNRLNDGFAKEYAKDPERFDNLLKNLKKMMETEMVRVAPINKRITTAAKNIPAILEKEFNIKLNKTLTGSGNSTEETKSEASVRETKQASTVSQSIEETLSMEFIDAVSAQENGAKKGFDGEKWYPYKSVEGGSDTLAYGHKLSDKEVKTGTINMKNGKSLKYKEGVSETDARELQREDFTTAYYSAKRVYEEKNPDHKFEDCSLAARQIAADIAYVAGERGKKMEKRQDLTDTINTQKV